MRLMSRDERDAFLMAGTRTAKLAVTRRDGRPHVVPVWFVLDGEDVVFNTGAKTIKGRSIRRTGRVAICVDDERPPFAFVAIEGAATASEDPAEMLEWATRIAARYVGEDQAEAYGRRNAGPGELLVRVRPDRVAAAADLTD